MALPWVLKASGTPGLMVADAAEVRRALEVFADPQTGCELLGISDDKGISKTRVGDDYDALLLAAQSMPAGIGVYFRVNPVPPTLTKSAKDGDIVRRRWLYVDADPVKAEGQGDNPATDDEKERTREVMEAVNEYLSGLGWPAPVITDSGNGYGLFFRIDLPNDELSKAIIKRILRRLSALFTGDKGKIDTSTFNANRLAKLPGTWAKKGQQSDDRPHRQCRLLYVPDVIESVGIEELQFVAGPDVKAEANGTANGTAAGPHPPTPFIRRAAAGNDSAYARKALDGECARVYLAQPGTRNNSLNRAAFSLGQLVGGGVLSEKEVTDKLFSAACRCGLDSDVGGERTILATIARAIEAGKEEPRKAPEKPSPRSNPNKTDPKREPPPDEAGASAAGSPTPGSQTAPLTVCLSKIKPLKVEWLIKDRMPKRFITVFAGRTSVGKSFLACDLIARLSTGGEIPFAGGECFTPGGTLILSEDSLEYVLAPRLLNANADLSRVHAMTWEAMAKYNLADTDMLEDACNEIPGGVSLVLIDPPTNFLDSIDEHKNAEVRQVVMRVVEWAMKKDLAILFILHVNKPGKGVEAINRVMGSVAWVTTARIAHSLCIDPNDPERCLWVPLKNNLGPLTKAIAYQIVREENGEGRLHWIEEVDTTADEAMGNTTPRPRRDVVAADWLVEQFREKREWESDELFKAAKQENISKDAIYEAKRKLDLPKARKQTRENGNTVWVWWVPPDWPPLTEDGEEEG